MPRIEPLSVDAASGKARTLLEGVQKKFGMVPNIMGTMAQAPAVLESYLNFGQALGGSSLSPALREQIALAVAGANHCDYCASAHTAIGKSLGVDDGELTQNLQSSSGDAKTQAALVFARRIVEERGWVTDADVQAAHNAGWTDAELLEILATTVVNIFTNYFNHFARTDVDFPVVSTGEPVAS